MTKFEKLKNSEITILLYWYESNVFFEEDEKIRRFPTIQVYSKGLNLLDKVGLIHESKLIDTILDSYAHTQDNKL